MAVIGLETHIFLLAISSLLETLMMLSIFTTSLIVDEVVLQVSACAGKALSMNRTESHVRNNVSLSRRIITSRGLLCRLRIIHARPSPAEAPGAVRAG